MGMYLNSSASYKQYRTIVSDDYFVDKTALLDELFPAIDTGGQYFCITRPRRFGKTVMANMVAAFFGKAVDTSAVFDKLAIAERVHYKKHLNQYQVIYIDFSRIPESCNSYEQYILRINKGIKQDLRDAYPEYPIDENDSIWDVLLNIFLKTNDEFVFVIDEWDAVFHMPFMDQKDQKEYLVFLKTLLKDQAYVKLVYMTGVLPIAKYSSGSELNMFVEYDMSTKARFSEYFGFFDTEVDQLFDSYRKNTKSPRIAREDLRIWYDGYHTAAGGRLYNPRSVVCALRDNQLASYWSRSGPYDEIFYYIKNNIDDVREDLALMVAGERIESQIRDYAAVSLELKTKAEIYSAMVVYGLLTYEDGEVFIPNKELMDQFQDLLMTKESLGYVYKLAKESSRMVKATLAGDTKTMAEILKYAHDTESPILSYNSEIELSAVVNLIYLAARDKYRVEREDKAGEGLVDFIFYPDRAGADGMILELKIDSSPEDAIKQIKDKNYILKFKGKLGEAPRYTGRILAVGISYDRKTKVHSCKVEVISQ